MMLRALQDIAALESKALEDEGLRCSQTSLAEEQTLIDRISSKIRLHVAPIIMLRIPAPTCQQKSGCFCTPWVFSAVQGRF